MTPPGGPDRPGGEESRPPAHVDRAYGVVDPDPVPDAERRPAGAPGARADRDADGDTPAEGGAPDAAAPVAPHGQPPDGDVAGARLLASGLRPRRTIGRLVDLTAVAGLLVTAALAVIGVRALVDLADRARLAAGFTPPTDGVDWFLLAVLVVAAAASVGGVLAARALVRRRHRRRLGEVLGPGASPLGRGPRPGLDRRAWMAALVDQPGWRAPVEEWRASGRLPAALATVGDGGELDEATYRSAALLVRDELGQRVGRRALATGLAVAVARSRVGDAAAVVSGSAEIQLDTLASLGLRPTARAHLRVARAALAGVAASSYLDIEDRLELELTVRAAVLGLESAGDAADALDDLISDDLADALAESFSGGSGAIGAAAGLVGGAFGVTGSVLRQVADLTEAVGAQITEGLVIAALLHHQGMTLAADALGLDDAHRAELTPAAGRVPAELVGVAGGIARRYRLELRRMLRRRTTAATRSAPRAVSDRLRRRDRGT